MATLIGALGSALEYRLGAELAPQVARELASLHPTFDTVFAVGGDSQWMQLMCDHPKYPRAHPGDIPKASLYVRYRISRRHQDMLKLNGQAWAIRRTETMMRLLLKRLAREVAKVK